TALKGWVRAMQAKAKSIDALLVALVVLGAATASVTTQAANVPKADQEYVWVAANVSHPFYAEGKAGWDAAATTPGGKSPFRRARKPGRAATDRADRGCRRQADDGGHSDLLRQ